ncbi:hypothetical protein [Flavihumibacter fluvii]|uniref:hypothetical protein n=1 Tax=Flavihumibacter fluvii TaxID=2838157 RepID=UPI001BDE2393|nr:hypothetical protein [Flavihumibacter fluvii]ULQ52888.1 hypothetical protein KJS93_00975 [Flavihumibacter fluvii]
MFTSKQHLTIDLGVDPAIAAFFVDRAVPKNNSYWKGRYLYVARGTGYLFIPLFFDLQRRAGVDLKRLLDEDYVQLMENILDLAGKYEGHELDFATHIQQIEALVSNRSVQPELLDDLRRYFSRQPQQPVGNIGTENPALNRGDALLYLLTVLPDSHEIIQKIIGYWYLLVPSFLLMDDIMDLHEDKEKQEENSLAHFGYDAAGVKKALAVLDVSFSKLEAVNPLLGTFFRSNLDRQLASPYFKFILNEKDVTG